MNHRQFVLEVFSRTPATPPGEYARTRMSVCAFSLQHAASKARSLVDCVERGKERNASYVKMAG